MSSKGSKLNYEYSQSLDLDVLEDVFEGLQQNGTTPTAESEDRCLRRQN